ncbi:sigma-70 family RNA polymerase sigma factor [Leptospira congkakensis]|uniref:RNA polymerase sigma factor n=4 Tax=Leptospiraceae TaxID=170 RepID=A0A4Z1AG94_9LEPT|nr:sigma-70 family RNA polymerase sigma factor [Leptospira congkakensis]EMY69582.1 putative sigma E factor negative regulatory protein RpoE [Leptospira vanthielii serovar Holland str. Waz Holland = ATCC 700522]MBM9547766.1 sigma-70 family RNA polymerase sigma factor [Leptospira abararensis]TGM60822.1 sigma-70 family RNA polymerase sigma factor [Leptospira vanthielii]TGL90120.1 sigma-70 family RNA polymerase sigma factor [Leptospira congkakensis]TGL91127.1 sigma-70 family RNA polymerase sigma f
MTLREKEKILLQKIKAGDPTAYMTLVSPFRERLFRKAVSMVKDGDDAEDIVQDALISGYKSIQNFRAEAGVYTWLYRIVVNKSKDLLAKKKRGREKPMDDSGDNQFVDSRVGYEKKLELSEESRYLMDKIALLEDSYKQVLELRYFENLSYNEIAEIMECNVGTVKSRLFKAKEFLKHLIQKDDKGEGFFEK